MTNKKIAYSEVYAFLNLLGEEYINKISPNVYKAIYQKRDNENPISIEIINGEINYDFSREALSLIAALNLQYFCENEEEKAKYINEYKKNSEILSEYNRQKYAQKLEDLGKGKDEQEENQEQVNIVAYKTSFLNKIFSYIKNIFRRNK